MSPDMPSDAQREGAVARDIAKGMTEVDGDDRGRPDPEPAGPAAPRGLESDWVSLSVAAQELGVSISALRKAFRNGRIVSRIVQGRHGPQRLVRLSEVSEVVGVRHKREYEPSQDATPADITRTAY